MGRRRRSGLVPARFCSACGAPLAPVVEHGHARDACTRCHRIAYRNSKPAATALVVRDGRVLLSRRARPPHQGEWDLPGGFLESGEHPEAGVLRELLEETGMRGRVVRLVSIAMGTYGEDDTLNLVYEIEAEGEPAARDDSLELRWWPPAQAPPMAFPHEAEVVRALTRPPRRP